VLVDDQAVDDLRFLIKLSCGLSYVQDGDARLPKTVRLRLTFLANALEFVDCVQECLQSLNEENLTLEEACSLLDDMPEELCEDEATVLFMGKTIKIFTAEIDKQAKRVEKGDIASKGKVTKVSKALIDIIERLSSQEMQGLTVARRKRR